MRLHPELLAFVDRGRERLSATIARAGELIRTGRHTLIGYFAPAAIESAPTTFRDFLETIRWSRAAPALGAATLGLAAITVVLWPSSGIRAYPPDLPSALAIEQAHHAEISFDPHGGEALNNRPLPTPPN